MRLAVYLLILFAVGCDSLPYRQYSRVILKESVQKPKAQQKLTAVAKDLGFLDIDCEQFKKSGIGLNDLAMGSTLATGDSTKCFKKLKNEGEHFYSDAFLIFSASDRSPTIYVEMWASPAGKDQNLIDLSSRFWYKVGRETDFEASVTR